MRWFNLLPLLLSMFYLICAFSMPINGFKIHIQFLVLGVGLFGFLITGLINLVGINELLDDIKMADSKVFKKDLKVTYDARGNFEITEYED